MSVPDYQSLMLPLLRRAAAATQPPRVIELQPIIAADLGLSDEDLAQRLASGRQGVFHNRLHWAKQYLTRAGVLSTMERGRFQLTDRGRALLAENLPVINNKVLARYPEFVSWLQANDNADPQVGAGPVAGSEQGPSSATPEEQIEAAGRKLEDSLKADLLDRVRSMPPSGFEDLISALLLEMGYGYGREERFRARGGPGDGGIDGVIHQDRLGLDRVYFQAKRYRDGNTVDAEAIRGFIGALGLKRASKGLFVTASSFTRQALEHAEQSPIPVVLIDGDRLAELMMQHGVGVKVRHTIKIKSVDESFFSDGPE